MKKHYEGFKVKLDAIVPVSDLEIAFLKELKDANEEYKDSPGGVYKVNDATAELEFEGEPNEKEEGGIEWEGNAATVWTTIDDIWDAYEEGGYINDYPEWFAEYFPAKKEKALIRIALKWGLDLDYVI